nr:MAG TPA: hypothetical protein [Caudoviricetes sp.]
MYLKESEVYLCQTFLTKKKCRFNLCGIKARDCNQRANEL